MFRERGRVYTVQKEREREIDGKCVQREGRIRSVF